MINFWPHNHRKDYLIKNEKEDKYESLALFLLILNRINLMTMQYNLNGNEQIRLKACAKRLWLMDNHVQYDKMLTLQNYYRTDF